jgi:probable non-F420 flavinoid oxidoreductase
MVQVGFHASHEQISPRELLGAVIRAEEVGFDAAMCSDHLAPWSERQGHSGFAWSWLGAALQATDLSFGVVTAPGQRYHPVITAQAIGTLGQMFPGRFWAALGSGEASNEHVTGDRWPEKATRDARLLECVDVIRALLRGEEVTHHGLVTVDRARIWDLPDEPPRLVGAAVSAQTAATAGGWADGLITINQPIDTLREVISSFRETGDDKPVYVQVHVSWAPTEDEALAIAHDQWRSNVFGTPLAWNLELPEQFDAAAKYVRPEDVRSSVVVSADLGGARRPPPRDRRARRRRDLRAPRRPAAGRVPRRLRREGPSRAANRGPMTTARTSDLWWKNAIVYCLDPETFLDYDGDGKGDLIGATERIDYLAGIGVSCLWLMPFYPSPNRDDGYDITDYYGVDPRLGSLGDFVGLVRTAKDRGMRVIIDLVVNHTSDRHPWFRDARKSKDSRFRDFYVWVDKPPQQPKPDVVFPDAEDSIWTYDKATKQWYLHHFYSHQPDLNVANPEVRDEIAKIAGFWLELGVDGFRVDAVPFLIEMGGTRPSGEVALDPHEALRDLRSFISRRRGDALLLGEVNLPPRGLREFFGDGDADELQMAFDFPLMQATYLAMARHDARPIRKALERRPEIPEEAQWGIFLRNHDELTLDQLSEKERAEVFAAFGPDEDMQLYGRGLRRRLPPMLGNDQARIRVAYSMLMSMPGTPVLFYGEEIGMGENLAVSGRLSVRTPMQWTSEANAGFSSASPRKLPRAIPDGEFGPMAINVADQRRDPSSLLNWFERVIRRRRETPEFGWGTPSVIDADGPKSVLAHACTWDGSTVVAVHNLSPEPCEVGVPLDAIDDMAEVDRMVDLLDESQPVRPVDGSRIELKLDGYGYRWLRMQRAGSRTTP